jgi:hypothetical protein
MSITIEKIGFEGLKTESQKTAVDQFSTMAKELVDEFVLKCRKENILPTFPRFEFWMMQNRTEISREYHRFF